MHSEENKLSFLGGNVRCCKLADLIKQFNNFGPGDRSGTFLFKYKINLLLAGSDSVAIQRAVERYDNIDINFADSREGKLFKVGTYQVLYGASPFTGDLVWLSQALKFDDRAMALWAEWQQDSLKCVRVQELADSYDSGDLDKFTDAIAEFDSMTRLDQWKTSLLLRAKKRIEAADEQDEEDFT